MENTAMHCMTQKGNGSSRKKKKPIPVDMHAISTMIIRSIHLDFMLWFYSGSFILYFSIRRYKVCRLSPNAVAIFE